MEETVQIIYYTTEMEILEIEEISARDLEKVVQKAKRFANRRRFGIHVAEINHIDIVFPE